ncbi:MAG: hypothetical protein KKB37_11320 [Alphaproteobacteria bacterium]|nr:hypothetical protein [Alphaproteobacteria bacterium]
MAKKITIAFANGGIVPRDQLTAKAAKDKKVGPHEPVDVVDTYGQSLIADRFAYEWDAKTAPKLPADPLAAAEKKAKEIIAAAEKKAQDLTSAAETKAGEIAAEAEMKAKEAIEGADKKADEIVAEAEKVAKEAAAPDESKQD